MMNTPVTAQYRVEYLSTGVSIDELRVVLMYIMSILLIDWKHNEPCKQKLSVNMEIALRQIFPPYSPLDITDMNICQNMQMIKKSQLLNCFR